MINRNEFQKIAKKFRSGGLSLRDFTDAVFAPSAFNPSNNHFSDGANEFRLPLRPANSHKGDFGRVLFIGGSDSMPGAIALSGLAALKTGTGLATVMTPIEAQPIVASFSPCLMTIGCKSYRGCFNDSCLDTILKKCEWADVVAIGPGMGRVPACRPIVGTIYRELTIPVVLDADAINNLADARVDLAVHAGPRVLTPHPGEFDRIAETTSDRRSDMEEYAINLARKTRTTIVLKGPQTLVTDGEQHYRNESGNAGMATAGSGDVLTGVIASLIGQKMEIFASAKTGCYVHGLAGDLYAEQSASATMIATDLIDALEYALSRVEQVRENARRSKSV